METLTPQLVNDVHSRLNSTRVAGIARPASIVELQEVIRSAVRDGIAISIAGGRHSMGGQQFGAGTLLIDTRSLDRPIHLDPNRGLLHMEAGVDWPAIIKATHDLQPDDPQPWVIRQKQTGADQLTLGGAISSNVHGRGLLMKPIADDIESLELINASGDLVPCSRAVNPELFSLVIGGYGLFGVVASATLRLSRRMKLRRLVNIIDIDEAIPAVRRRVSEGCLYGDFQYAIDPTDDAFLRRGVLACYTPVDYATPVSDDSADLNRENWINLLHLAHTDKRRAFDLYCAHYLSTHGRVYYSDTMQLSTYIPSYSEFLAEKLAGAGDSRGVDESLMIGELYVPPDRLIEFTAGARQVLRSTGVEDIYGTIRSILRDDTSFMPWAREDYACVIFNLRTKHTPEGIDQSSAAFRGLHDVAARLGGSFFLTYHRYATAQQVEACHPNFRRFLSLKRVNDPNAVFQNDWYRHYTELYSPT